MKKLWIVALLVATACGGSLSDEQRRRLHEGMDDQKIVKMTDADITEAGIGQGRKIFEALQKAGFDSTQTNAIARRYHAKIRWITPGTSNALDVEKQLIEAYVIGAETGATQDNIQKIHQGADPEAYDTLLYSRPILTPLPDGAVNVEGVWNIYLAKKQVIIGAGKKKK